MKLIIPPPFQVAILALVMWFIDKELPEFRLSFSSYKLLTLLLVFCGIAITAAAILKMFSVKTTLNPLNPAKASQLVTDGIFGFSRNPIYVGDLLFLTAWLVWLGNPANVLPLLLFPLYITAFQIKPEEEALLNLFDDEYKLYCNKVGRWL